MNSFKEFRLEEALKIKQKNWDFNVSGYTVEINDKDIHSILNRNKDRTELSLNDLKLKLQIGLDYIKSKIDNNFFTQDTMIALKYEKSEFVALILVKPNNKYIRISSILDINMFIKNAVKWNINEFIQEFPEYKDIITSLNEENCTSPLLNYSLLFEQNDSRTAFEIYTDCLSVFNLD